MTEPAKRTGPITLLLVDDDEGILKALQRAVRSEGYRVLTANSAPQALQIIAAEAIDMVLSDVDMPGMSGVDLMVALRKSHPSIVRLLLTGRGTLSAAMGAINQGEVYRFMTKPWGLDELREALRQAAARAMENRAEAMKAEEGSERAARLQMLERLHPGITSVAMVGGAYRIDVTRLRAALQTLSSAPLLACWPPGEP